MADKRQEKVRAGLAFNKRKAVNRGRRISNATISLILSFVVTAAAQSERINQEGRILGPAPVVTTPTVFNTPQADPIVFAMQIFPVSSEIIFTSPRNR
jgi:hypothetical protein